MHTKGIGCREMDEDILIETEELDWIGLEEEEKEKEVGDNEFWMKKQSGRGVNIGFWKIHICECVLDWGKWICG